jgi:DNA invertase Pin-like site-specific DNA recombinase
MNESLKVQPHHLERGAYLYVRQSSMRQVIENIESTKRQYALRGRAVALGWRDDQIIVIDNDQGESGLGGHSKPANEGRLKTGQRS